MMTGRVCGICGGRIQITETPYLMPWIGLLDERGKGGRVTAICESCGAKTREVCYCGWPVASGHILTREESIEIVTRELSESKA